MTKTITIPAETATVDQVCAAFEAGTLSESEAPAVFAIDSTERLAWYGRKRAGMLAEIATVKASADALIADLEGQLKSFDDRFLSQAEHFARQELQSSGAKTKTLKTLGGSFSFRTVPGGIRKAEPHALLAWAKDNAPGLIDRQEIVKEDIPAAALKGYYQSTGEIPPGAELVPDRETFAHKA